MGKLKREILSVIDLEIGFVSRGRKRTVLTSPLNATASSGEFIAVIGHNGVGKSTLLRTITGLQSLLGGNVFIKGKNIEDYSRTDIARNVGYISTEPVSVGNMTVYDLVALGRYPHTNWIGKINDDDHNTILSSIVKVGMTDFNGKYINELSDGEKQRAMIARVLAQDTGLLIMDEPTAFLDISNKFEIVHLMHTLTRERGKTVIFSTHDLQTAINTADKIWLVLENGIIEGAPEDLILNDSFDSLFSDSRLKFNKSEGSFVINKDNRKSIRIDGDGLQRLWTEKALNRIGYDLSNTGNMVRIVSEGNVLKWELLFKDQILEFYSIYELVVWLDGQDS